ncbi:MAG: hypothetical protein V7631_2151 [Massilia sp.]|jgi:hypothetical protein
MRLLSLALLALAVPLSRAADAAAVAAIAQYEGADRNQRLIEGARREGSLTENEKWTRLYEEIIVKLKK